MKVLLIVPPSTMEERYGSFQEAGAIYPSMGLASIAACAERAGYAVTVIDAEASGLSMEAIRARLSELQPDVIGMQTFCANLERCHAVATAARKLCPQAKIVLGGVQVTMF
ncbi:cobalamin B12-binding domain-containing protein, partial [bacterium]|nr:cobalamin B12-binding domain-containing protein [candidate division CSSED10-310 bacterium]